MKEREALKLALSLVLKGKAYADECSHMATQADIDKFDIVATAIKEALAQPEQEPVGPSGDSLSDFQADQWWVRELDAAVSNGTHDQKRAVAVVRNMIATAQAHLEASPPQRKPLTHEQRFDLLTKFEPHKNKWEAPAILIDMVEAAHGIKEKNA